MKTKDILALITVLFVVMAANVIILNEQSSIPVMLISGAVILLTLILYVVFVIKRSKHKVTDAMLSDPDNWKGFIYYNRNDPRLFVPKRYGIGWTFNFGNILSFIIIACITIIPLLVTLILSLVL